MGIQGLITIGEGENEVSYCLTEESMARYMDVINSNKQAPTTAESSPLLSAAELYTRIHTRDTFKQYRSEADFLDDIATLQELSASVNNIDAVAGHKITSGDASWYESLTNETKAALKSKYTIYNSFDTLKKDPLYTDNAAFKEAIDNLQTKFNIARTATIAFLNTAEFDNKAENDDKSSSGNLEDLDVGIFFHDLDDEEGSEEIVEPASPYDTMSVADLIKTGETTKNYTVYRTLADIEAGFTIKDNQVDVEALIAKYPKEDDFMPIYVKYGNTAKTIDVTVLDGLMATESLDISVPNAPEAGLFNPFENGSVDIGTITILIATTIAAVLGVSFIAKLYLKHKF